MANRVKITFPNQPSNFYLMSFSVYNAALGYTRWISKQFISGTPSASNHIQIGATLADTMNNLLANLNSYNLDGNATYQLGSAGVFYINLSIPETYEIIILTDTYITTFETETVTIPANDTLAPLDIKHFQILVYDTYVNSLDLTLEFSKKNACKISWDSGDDIYKNIMASQLVFDMLVENYEDAHFKHLFTGDEQRYRVELNAINVSNVSQLIWQGFLLPDQYTEPYTNSGLFPGFTASDMLSSMKGKYFEPWYYQNKLPIAEVISLALKYTGLEQNLIVKPVLIPATGYLQWQSICVDLRDYVDNGKYDDCYTILEKILTAQGLTIFNFRGFWWLEGCSRKHEVSTTALQFDTDGKRIVDIDLVKEHVALLMQAETPLITSISPWKAVNLNFKGNGTNNLFSNNVVRVPKDEEYNTIYSSGNYTGPPTPVPIVETYKVGKIKDWNPHFNSEFLYMYFNTNRLMWKTLLFAGSSYSDWVGGFDYFNYTESMVLNNYLECKEKPFVKPGILYELEAEFNAENVIININPNDQKKIEEKLAAGGYDKFFPVQIFLNGVEKFSNRPSFGGNVDLRYETSSNITGYGEFHCNFKFKLKFKFKVSEEGTLSFRILTPILINGLSAEDDLDDNTNISRNCFFCADVLKLTAVDGYDENLNLIAKRDINYTQELDYTLPITATPDNSVLNSFSLGSPISNQYIKTIDKLNTPYEVLNYNFFSPNILLELALDTFKIDYSLMYILFAENKLKSVFLEKTDGTKQDFSSLWYYYNNPTIRLGYLTSFDPYPVIPKKYKYYPDVASGDVIKYMNVEYATEDFSNRLKWKLYGSSFVDTYPKTMARALHGVRPDVMLRLEASNKGYIWPDNLLSFYYDNEDRDFIPTRIEINLFENETTFTSTEAKFVDLGNEISYE